MPMAQRSDDPVMRLFRALDDDANSKISAAEWQGAFDGIDRDGDGIITRKEFALAGGDTRMFDCFDRRQRCALRRVEWQEAFRSVDADRSSEITVAEWRAWLKNATSRVGLSGHQAQRLAEARDRRRREEAADERRQGAELSGALNASGAAGPAPAPRQAPRQAERPAEARDRNRGAELSKALRTSGAAKQQNRVRVDSTPSFAPAERTGARQRTGSSAEKRGVSHKLELALGFLEQSLAAGREGAAAEATRLREQVAEGFPECVSACRDMEERLRQLGEVEADQDASLVAVTCLCGSVFRDDSRFCRKCGRKRMEESPADVLRRRLRRLLVEASRHGNLGPALTYVATKKSSLRRRSVSRSFTQKMEYVGSYGQLVGFLRECHTNNPGQLPQAKLHQLLAAVEDLGQKNGDTSLVKDRARQEGQEAAFSDIMGNLGISVQKGDDDKGGKERDGRAGTLERSLSRRCSAHSSLDPVALMDDFNFDSRNRIGNKKRDVKLLVSLLDTPFAMLSRYNIDEDKLTVWMEAVADQYADPSVVGYHNWRHACDVFQFSFRSLHNGGASDYFSMKDMLALLLASVGHDAAHPGTNNAFQVKTRSKLALLYNDKSVLENMHASVFFELAQDPARAWMDILPQKHYEKFRSKVVEAILATDMSHHFELVDRFSTRVAKKDDDPFFVRDEEPDAANIQMQKATKADRLMLIQAFVHMADLGHCARPWDIHKHGVAGLEVEFFSQGDKERELGMPVCPLMDRTKDSVAAAQEFFLAQLVLPVLQPYVTFLEDPLATDYLESLDNNRQRWKDLISKHGKKMVSEMLALEEPE